MSRTLTTWLAALALALILAGLGTGLDDMDAMRAVQASVQDAQAQAQATMQRGLQARREAAARQICGPHATPRWIDETTISCSQVERMASIAYALSHEAAHERRQAEQQTKARP